ncbi:hypothetical protein FB45DRAFT_901388 [Roridomyces roridus]|uniref:Transaldolase n=1 Tax=Roridomyces roridus TaxID=1738132 RepID=A0AAD7C8R3_9AGAR|nr:hypothetical protein FB45DRAFT_901388 [Roridomyces roridus]
MSPSPTTSLLAQIRGLLTIDVDSMDPAFAARYSTPLKFCDMTSNQALVHAQADLVSKDSEESGDFEQDVVDLLTVLLAKEVYPHLTGNVHAQTSPSAAHDTQKTVDHARKLVSRFGEQGIPKNRVCIKIPATPESLLACRELQNEGIQTLATCLFSLPQAVAASQAGCVYVAPYFNELRVHFEPGLWKEYADPKTEHPMSAVILSIVHTFREIGSKTLVMPARFVSSLFVIALTSLTPNHITIGGPILDALAALPALSLDSFAPPAAATAVFPHAIASDREVTRKLVDALDIFGKKEMETRELVGAFVCRRLADDK